MLHIAAQGDQPVTLYYFHRTLSVPIERKDNRGSTPLHWACFSKSELAALYILSWTELWQLSIQDVDGYTPLHLAIKSVGELQSCRPVRALLFRGSPKYIRDKNGQSPVDAAHKIESPSLKNELIEYLEQTNGIQECLMLKTPIKKMDKSC